MDKWNAIRFFIATAEAGSFAGAAKVLGTDPSTISKAVRRLEEELAILLFQRTTRQLSLTEAGYQYLDSVRKAHNLVAASERELQDQTEKPQGRLKINCPVNYGRRYLTPALIEFQNIYPEIELEVHFSDAYVDLVAQEFDLGIRSGSLKDSGLIGRQLSPMDFITVAGPKLAKDLPKHFSQKDFDQWPWIRFKFLQSGRLMPILAETPDGLEEINPGAQMSLNDADAMVDLCCNNLGITQLPHFAVKKEIDRGDLIPLFPAVRHSEFGVYVIYPERQYLPHRTKLLINHLVTFAEQLGETPRDSWATKISHRFSWV